MPVFLFMKIMYTYIIKTRYIRFLWRTYIFISFGLLLYAHYHILLKAMVAIKIINLSCSLNWLDIDWVVKLLASEGWKTEFSAKNWAKIRAQWLKGKDLDDWIFQIQIFLVHHSVFPIVFFWLYHEKKKSSSYKYAIN